MVGSWLCIRVRGAVNTVRADVKVSRSHHSMKLLCITPELYTCRVRVMEVTSSNDTT